MMEKRKTDILCVQETRWKGNKASELGAGSKLIYRGTDAEERSGVGVVLSRDLKSEKTGGKSEKTELQDYVYKVALWRRGYQCD